MKNLVSYLIFTAVFSAFAYGILYILKDTNLHMFVQVFIAWTITFTVSGTMLAMNLSKEK